NNAQNVGKKIERIACARISNCSFVLLVGKGVLIRLCLFRRAGDESRSLIGWPHLRRRLARRSPGQRSRLQPRESARRQKQKERNHNAERECEPAIIPPPLHKGALRFICIKILSI